MTNNRFYFKLLPVISISLTCQRLWLHKKKKKAALSAKRRLNNWNKKYLKECHLVTYWPVHVPVQNINCCSVSEAVTCWLKGFFFFLTAIFLQLIDDGLIFLLSLAHCLRTDRDQSLKSQRGLWRIKWNQSPLSGCSQSTSQSRQWQEMLRNSWCRERHFPLQIQPYWCAFLCTLWSSMPSPGISDSFKSQFNR